MPIFEDQKSENIYLNLIAQVDRIYRHCRQGSYRTRPRYRAAMVDYCAFVAQKYHLQKLANTKDKHVKAWVVSMQSRHLAPSTIKTNLSGLRFFLAQTSDADIVRNEYLGLTKRVLTGIDRYWLEEEFVGMQSIATKLNRYDIVLILQCSRYMGLRIHEIIKMDRAQVEKALRQNEITVRGKGGRIRNIPLSPEAKEILLQLLDGSRRGEKIFVSANMKAHQVQHQVRNFIYNHREKVQHEFRPNQIDQQYMRELGINGYSAALTIHGLRHLWAKEQYIQRRDQGLSPKQARKEVAHLVGHGRDQVTSIYLGYDKEVFTQCKENRKIGN